jgi:oligopeptide transport system ATP-binding protein
MDEKKVLLSLEDVEVKFKVRGRTLQAIRKVNLDIYDGESIAIVGESGSGKSVLTKTFSGMLDSNGYVSGGSIVYNDPELSITNAKMTFVNKAIYNKAIKKLDEYSKLEYGKEIYDEIKALKAKEDSYKGLTGEEIEEIQNKIADLDYERIEAYNKKLALSNKPAISISTHPFTIFVSGITFTNLCTAPAIPEPVTCSISGADSSTHVI